MRTKRITLYSLLAIFIVSLTLALCLFIPQKANAVGELTINDFTLLDGASLRLTDEYRGIRFILETDDDNKGYIYSQDNKTATYVMGIVVLPTAMVDGDITVDTPNVARGELLRWSNVSGNTGKSCLSLVLYDIPVSAYSLDLTARGYLRNRTTGEIVYTDRVVERNVAEVSSKLLAKGTYDSDANKTAVLNDYVDVAVESLGASAQDINVKNLDGALLYGSNISLYTKDSISVSLPKALGEIRVSPKVTVSNGAVSYSVSADYNTLTLTGVTASNAVTVTISYGTAIIKTLTLKVTDSDVDQYVLVDANGNPNNSGGYVLFGSYPQSKVTDGDTVAMLNGFAGNLPTVGARGVWTAYNNYVDGSQSEYSWYVDIVYNGVKYRGVYYTQYRPFLPGQEGTTDWSYQGDNGYDINTVYWFKYEPIKWQIIYSANGKLSLVSASILDVKEYYYESLYAGETSSADGTYATSNIRTWLNADFYSQAFNGVEAVAVNTVSVPNDASTTESNTNQNVCGTTQDKVYLLGYDTAVSLSSRQKKGTDYALCQGLAVDLEGSYAGYGSWYTRSLSASSKETATVVDALGNVSYGDVYMVNIGVVPAIDITA